jgi:hypothetical protein
VHVNVPLSHCQCIMCISVSLQICVHQPCSPPEQLLDLLSGTVISHCVLNTMFRKESRGLQCRYSLCILFLSIILNGSDLKNDSSTYVICHVFTCFIVLCIHMSVQWCEMFR